MKITKIRTKKNEIPSTNIILQFERELRQQFKTAGFITNVNAETRTGIKIGLRMRSFSLDLTKHSRNLYISPYGDKLTNLPTWDQRVVFNNIVNKVMNKYKLSGNVKSGPYTIRQGFTVMDEYDWQDQKPDYVYANEMRGHGPIVSVNEKEYLEERRIDRNLAAKVKREEYKKTKEYHTNMFNKKADTLINTQR